MLSQALKEATNQRDRNRLDGGSHHMFVVATKEIMLDLYILYLRQWVTTTGTPEAKLESFPQIQNWGQLEKKKKEVNGNDEQLQDDRLTTRWRHRTNSDENGSAF